MPETVTGTRAIRPGAVAELALVVLAPALNRAAAQHRAGVLVTCGNRDGVSDARNRDGHGAIRRGAVAELAFAVVAPALNRAVAQQRAAVILARGNRDGIGDARNPDGHEAIRPGAVAELALVVLAPALNRAAAQQRAAVILARGDYWVGFARVVPRSAIANVLGLCHFSWIENPIAIGVDTRFDLYATVGAGRSRGFSDEQNQRIETRGSLSTLQACVTLRPCGTRCAGRPSGACCASGTLAISCIADSVAVLVFRQEIASAVAVQVPACKPVGPCRALRACVTLRPSGTRCARRPSCAGCARRTGCPGGTRCARGTRRAGSSRCAVAEVGGRGDFGRVQRTVPIRIQAKLERYTAGGASGAGGERHDGHQGVVTVDVRYCPSTG